MKKHFFVALFLGLSTLSATASSSLPDLTEEMLNNFMERKMPEMIIECPKGATLPRHVSIKGDFFNYLGDDSNPLTLEKTFYVRFEGEDWVFSSDLQDGSHYSILFYRFLWIALSVREKESKEASFISEIYEKKPSIESQYNL